MSTVMTEGVEIGGSGYAAEEVVTEAKPVQETPIREEAADDGEEPVLELSEDDEIVDEGEGESDRPRKKEKTAQERINELYRQTKDLERALERERGRAEGLLAKEKLLGGERLLQGDATSGNNTPRVAPDPTDQAKYPLGALDDRYVEDKIQFGIEQALGSVLHRQQEDARKADDARKAQEHLQKAQEIVKKGLTLHPDYEEVVWNAAQRGELNITEDMFLEITEAENGIEIAYFLGKNPAEADRVARLPPRQQGSYIARKDAEFAAQKTVRLPKAGTPPAHTARGSSSRSRVDASDLNTSLAAISKELFR